MGRIRNPFSSYRDVVDAVLVVVGIACCTYMVYQLGRLAERF